MVFLPGGSNSCTVAVREATKASVNADRGMATGVKGPKGSGPTTLLL